MTISIPTPASSSPLSAIQGGTVYGDGIDATTTSITYSFGNFIDTQTWTAGYMHDFRAALAVIESVANIDFVEVSQFANPDLLEVIAPSSFSLFPSSNTLGFHYTPSNNTSLGAFNTDYWIDGINGAPGGYFFTTILHELGHALGLGHPHDTGLETTVMQGVTNEFNSFGTAGLNQGIYTVMSYNDGWTSENGILPVSSSYGGSTGLGALDIAALQAMYGANTTTASGGNTYVLPSSNTGGTGYQSIWDTGGIDTIQSNSILGATIDLRGATLTYSNGGGGYVSHVNGIDGGFTVANGVVIENATGGSGNDTLVGNTSENVLTGNGGNDVIHSISNGSNNNTINAGGGNDTIYLANGSGADTVNGNAGNDKAFVTNNSGSFAGGAGYDTVVFVRGLNNYLLQTNGGNYEFVNVITHETFTVANDVEVFEFSNGSQRYFSYDLTSATQIIDIETTGTALQHANQGIYLLGGSAANVAVTLNGRVVGENTFTGWSAIQVEATGNGYRVLWEEAGGQYSEWTLDNQGVRQSGTLIDNVIDVEVFYNVDINNDGTIGHFTTMIESDGSTTLTSSTEGGAGGTYLIDGSIEITRNGAEIGPNSLNSWSVIHAEAGGGGYRVLWEEAGGQYSEWFLNGQGEWQNGTLIDNVIDVEVFYNVDINNDGTIGHFTTMIESDGSTTLASSTRGIYLIDGSTEITLNGEAVGPNSFAGWSVIHAEATGGGYRVLWEEAGGQYSEWTLDNQGVRQSGTLIDNVIDVEVFYNVDINNDGTIGHFTTMIESDGSTTLTSSTEGGAGGTYLIDGSIEITRNGAEIGPNSLNSWSVIHAEAGGGGYRVLWEEAGGQYSEWFLNGQGEWQNGTLIDNVIDVEVFYNVDINNDGTIGHFTTMIESDGSTTLASSTRGIYLIDGSTEITLNGEAVGPNSFAGWSVIHAEATGGGYRVLWEEAGGQYSEWALDNQGVRQSGTLIDNVADVEAFYGHDIDGSGIIGLASPKVAQPSDVNLDTAPELAARDASEWNALTDDPEFEFVAGATAENHRSVDTFDVSDLEIMAFLDFDDNEGMFFENASRDLDQTDTSVSGASIFDEDIFML